MAVKEKLTRNILESIIDKYHGLPVYVEFYFDDRIAYCEPFRLSLDKDDFSLYDDYIEIDSMSNICDRVIVYYNIVSHLDVRGEKSTMVYF